MKIQIREDLLYRLRWNLVAPLHDIEIAIGPKNEEKLIPLFDHPCVEANISVPSLRHLEVMSDDMWRSHEAWHHGDDSPEPDCACKPPPNLVIENANGRPITLRQFVTQVHAYFNEHMVKIKRAMTMFQSIIPGEAIPLFQRAWNRGTRDPDVLLSVYLTLERDWEVMEEHWVKQLEFARRYEDGRFGDVCDATSGRDA